jgi:hypothetical protein
VNPRRATVAGRASRSAPPGHTLHPAGSGAPPCG